MLYLSLKLLHILSATLVFGSGICLALLGTVVFSSKNVSLITQAGPAILKLELYLTVVATLSLLASGFAMAWLAGFALFSAWLGWALVFFLIAAACWLPGLRLQHTMLTLAQQSLEQASNLPERYQRELKRWLWLGLPSTLAMTAIFYLMVFKPV